MNDHGDRAAAIGSGANDRTDAELFLACRKGNDAAWDELVSRYQRLIYAIPRRAGLNDEQCADVFQDVFLTLFQRLDEIEQPEKIRSWMVTTAKFKTWAIIRGGPNKFETAADSEEGDHDQLLSVRDDAPLADDVLIELEQQHLIRNAVTMLDERCRQIISMIYLRPQAASYEEVAKAIGTGSTSVSPLRTRCLAKLEKLLR